MATQKFLGIDLTSGLKKIYTALISSTGASDGGKLVATDPVTGKLDISLMPVGVGANVVSAQASEALVVGFVNLYNAAGVYKVRKAIATGRSTKADGFVIQAYANGETATVYYDNSVLAGLTGLTPDAEYFLSDSAAGGVTTTPPTSGAGKIIQFVGKSKSATELVVDIEEAYEIA